MDKALRKLSNQKKFRPTSFLFKSKSLPPTVKPHQCRPTTLRWTANRARHLKNPLEGLPWSAIPNSLSECNKWWAAAETERIYISQINQVSPIQINLVQFKRQRPRNGPELTVRTRFNSFPMALPRTPSAKSLRMRTTQCPLFNAKTPTSHKTHSQWWTLCQATPQSVATQSLQRLWQSVPWSRSVTCILCKRLRVWGSESKPTLSAPQWTLAKARAPHRAFTRSEAQLNQKRPPCAHRRDSGNPLVNPEHFKLKRMLTVESLEVLRLNLKSRRENLNCPKLEPKSST